MQTIRVKTLSLRGSQSGTRATFRVRFSTKPFTAGILIQSDYPFFAELHDLPHTGESWEPDCLQLDGFHVDQIVAVSDVIHSDLNDELPIESIRNQPFNFPLFPRPDKLYVTNSREPLDVAILHNNSPWCSLRAPVRRASLSNGGKFECPCG